MAAPAPITITTTPGYADITVDGHPVPAITAFRLEQATDEIARLTIWQYAGAGRVEGDAIVYVVDPDADNPTHVITDFLASIDPDQLERDALARADLGGSVTAAILAQLAAYITA